MTADAAQDIKSLKAIGRICAETLRRMMGLVRAGMTTRELDGYYADTGASMVCHSIRAVRTHDHRHKERTDHSYTLTHKHRPEGSF